MNDCTTDFTQTIIAFPKEAQAPSVKREQEKHRHSCTFLNKEAVKSMYSVKAVHYQSEGQH